MMTDNEQRAHDFAMALVQDRLARGEYSELLDLIAQYNIAFAEMKKELDGQDSQE